MSIIKRFVRTAALLLLLHAAPMVTEALAGAPQLSAGWRTTLVLHADGTVLSTGYKYSGTDDAATPMRVPGLRDVTTVRASSDRGFAVRGDGTLWAWGANQWGELGTGSTWYGTQRMPKQVQGVDDVATVEGGRLHTIALKTDGTVWAWGYNDDGELGDGTKTYVRAEPAPVLGLSGVVAIAAGDAHNLAVKGDGTVWGWGANWDGQLGDGTKKNRFLPVQVKGIADVVAVAAGDRVSVALKSDGTVWTWGGGATGELGNGALKSSQKVPGQVQGLDGVIAISAGTYHVLALKNDGTAWAWGYNEDGQVGGVGEGSTVPVRVSGLEGVVAVAAGSDHSTAMLADGSVWEWGNVRSGMPTAVPVQVTGLGQATAIAAGNMHSSAVTSTGIATWGLNWNGQLGDGTDVNRSTPGETAPNGALSPFVAAAAGIETTVGLRQDGTVWWWGGSSYREQPGSNHAVPQQVQGLGGITSVAGGDFFAFALDGTGQAWSWGMAEPTPKALNGGHDMKTISVHGFREIEGLNDWYYVYYQNILGLRRDGTIWRWKGGGSLADWGLPQRETGLAGVVSLAAGERHSLALKGDGTVWAWGRNSAGQLGTGDEQPVATVVQVSGLSDVVAMAAGENHSVAVKSDGTVWTWGAGYQGQLGNGAYRSSSVPVQVAGLAGVTAVSAGDNHTIALKNDGTVWAWGANDYGQLGTDPRRYGPRRTTFDPTGAPGEGDREPPVINSFSIPATSPDPTVPVLALSATDNSGITGYCLGDQHTPDCTWEASPPATYTFRGINKWGPDHRVLYAWTRDDAGNISDPAIARVDVTIGKVRIVLAGGAATTSDRKVKVDVVCDGPWPDYVQFSTDGKKWGRWKGYEWTSTLNLPAGAGPKTVYVRLKDRFDEESPVFSANIVLQAKTR